MLPMAPMIEQNSGTIDVQAIFRDVARYSNMPEVNEYVTWVDKSDPSAGKQLLAQPPTQGGPPPGPQERVGRPGMTPGGASAAMQQILLGSDPGGANKNAPTGE